MDKIKYSIPFNGDLELIRWAISEGQVYEVYFAGPKNKDFSDPYENLQDFSQSDIKILLDICKTNGIRTNLLLNRSTLFFEDAMELISYVRSIQDSLDSITIADPYGLRLLRTKFPEINIQSSIYMGLDKRDKVREAARMGIGTVCLEPSINRDFQELKRIKCLKEHYPKLRVKLLATLSCFNYCFYASRHSQLPILKKVLDRTGLAQNKHVIGNLLHIYKCHHTHETIADEIKKSFIRPDDIWYYEEHGLADEIKLAYRCDPTDTLKEKMSAYFKRSYQGDLFRILDTGKLRGLSCDNSKFPEDFIETVMHCDKVCEKCTYCQDIADKAIRKA